MSIPELHNRTEVKGWEMGFSLAHRLLDIGEVDAAVSLINQMQLLMPTLEEIQTPADAIPFTPTFSLSRLRLEARRNWPGVYAGGFNVRFLGGFTLIANGKTLHLSPRLQEILLLILLFPGITPERIAAELYEDGQIRPVKANVSKLRKLIPVSTCPYTLRVGMFTDVQEVRRALTAGEIRRAVELYRGPLLPTSVAPGVVRERHVLDESIKRAVLESGNAELILALTDTHEEDLEIWEAAQQTVERDDPRSLVIDVEVERIRDEWGITSKEEGS